MDVLALLLALGLVVLNGFFVATEFAIVKIRPTRIEELIREKRPGAHAVRHLVVNLDAYLSATQLGITIASLGLGWIGKPAFARILAWPLTALGFQDQAWIDSIAATSAFLTISFLHIVVGELAPKTLALVRSDSVGLFAAYPMRFFYALFFPFIWSLNAVSNSLLRLLGVNPTAAHGDGHSEEELKLILAQARSAGLLSGPRADLLKKALTLTAKTARHLMVPRNEVIFLDVHCSLQENISRAMSSDHSRFPLCDRELDNAIGIVELRDLLFQSRNADDLDLREIASPAVYLPEMMTAERLLSEFPNRHLKMAFIVDEYGGASGIVTPSDIVAAVMGELEDYDESEMVQLPGGAYDVEGIAPIEELEEALRVTLKTDDMRTVAGFLMDRLGRMPRIGDRISECGYNFVVVDVSGPRVRKVRIQREATAGQPPPPAPAPQKESEHAEPLAKSDTTPAPGSAATNEPQETAIIR